MTNLAQVSSGGMTHSTCFRASTGAPTPPSGSRGVGGALLGLTTRLRLQKGRVEHVGGADAEPGQSPGLSRPWRCGKAGGRPSPGIEAAK